MSIAMHAVAASAGLAKSGEAVKSGPIGLAVILVLCIACYFLFKSMSKHLRTVREEFPKDEPARTPPAASVRSVAQPAPQKPDVEETPGTASPPPADQV